MKKLIGVLLFMASLCSTARGQDVALKTNVLYDAALTVNAGLEIGLAPRWSLDVSGNFNGWTLDSGKRWKHWMVQPEARYWFCDRFAGHFLGFHALGGQYNFGGFNPGVKFLGWGRDDEGKYSGTDLTKLKDHRYQGWGVGAGIAYGYAWILGKHWNLEAEIGVGYIYTRFDKYECKECGKKLNDGELKHNYVGPTKAAINLVYVF